MTIYRQTPYLGTAYYVDATLGDDAHSGSSEEPWQTIAKVNSQTFIPGNLILLKRGEHWHERLVINDAGAPSAPIIIGDYSVGALPILDGVGVTIPSYGGLIDVQGAVGAHVHDYIVRNIRLQYAGQAMNNMYNAIYMRYVDNLRITGCNPDDVVDSGIMLRNCASFEVDNNLVENCSHATENMDECVSLIGSVDGNVHHNEVHSADITPKPGMNIGINAKQGCARVYIHHNYIHNVYSSGVYTDAWDALTEDIYIYNNRVHDTHYGVACNSEAGGLLRRVYMYNNLCYRILWIGATISGGTGPRQDIYIFNNTLAKTLENWFAGLRVETANLSGTILLKNNAVYWHDPDLGANTTLGQIVTVPGAISLVTADHNIVYGENDYQTDPTMPELDNAGEETWADPLFTDWANDVYTVGATSPCRNGGTVTGLPFVPSTDYAGNPRVCGAAIDVGCYEYQE
jgi:hypothetical protein